MGYWDTYNILRQLFNECYGAKDKGRVYIRYEDPLIINNWEEWLGLKSLFIYFTDLNRVEWAQGPIFLSEDHPLQDWANAFFANNKERVLMMLFLEQGRLHAEAQPTRVFEDELDYRVVPICITTPITPFGLLPHTPCNISFTMKF